MSISHTVWSLDAKKPLEAASLNDESVTGECVNFFSEILSLSYPKFGEKNEGCIGEFYETDCFD